MKTSPDATTDLLSVDEVRALMPGRWRSAQSLAAASRRGSGPPGRLLIGSSRAAYVKAEVLRWLAGQAAVEEARLRTLRARAAIAREALARSRRAAASGGPEV